MNEPTWYRDAMRDEANRELYDSPSIQDERSIEAELLDRELHDGHDCDDFEVKTNEHGDAWCDGCGERLLLPGYAGGVDWPAINGDSWARANGQ